MHFEASTRRVSYFYLRTASLEDIYDIISLDSAYEYEIPKDYFTALNHAKEDAMGHPAVTLDVRTQLHLFELSKITMTGGINSPSMLQ